VLRKLDVLLRGVDDALRAVLEGRFELGKSVLVHVICVGNLLVV
jgi:hypothetical protein